MKTTFYIKYMKNSYVRIFIIRIWFFLKRILGNGKNILLILRLLGRISKGEVFHGVSKECRHAGHGSGSQTSETPPPRGLRLDTLSLTAGDIGQIAVSRWRHLPKGGGVYFPYLQKRLGILGKKIKIEKWGGTENQVIGNNIHPCPSPYFVHLE